MNWKKVAFDLLEQLVSVPSVNPGDTPLTNGQHTKICNDGKEKQALNGIYGERQVGDILITYLKRNLPTFSCWKEEVLPKRFNIYASYHRGDDYPTILLETHLDTVDVKGMTVEPFRLMEKEDKWYGRGACDAKGQLTAMIIGLRKAMAECKELPVNILLVAVIDEEHRHRGVDYLVENAIQADLAIVGEPTELKFGAFHKGSIRFVLETVGKSAHSSTPWDGENAIEKMADVISILKGEAKRAAENVVHPLCGQSSLSVTLISGGEQVNIIPNSCSIHVDRRLNPGENWQEVLEQIKEIVHHHVCPNVWDSIVWNYPYLIDPPLTNDLSEKGLLALSNALGEIKLDFNYVGLQFGCDASKIQPAGIPTVVFGPGSIAQAHTADEWISSEELMKAIDIYASIFKYFKM